tara:strand:+ start:1606 stop:1815 length:210 start_codon:yes stop_codon:yes gene_type:complete
MTRLAWYLAESKLLGPTSGVTKMAELSIERGMYTVFGYFVYLVGFGSLLFILEDFGVLGFMGGAGNGVA